MLARLLCAIAFGCTLSLLCSSRSAAEVQPIQGYWAEADVDALHFYVLPTGDLDNFEIEHGHARNGGTIALISWSPDKWGDTHAETDADYTEVQSEIGAYSPFQDPLYIGPPGGLPREIESIEARLDECEIEIIFRKGASNFVKTTFSNGQGHYHGAADDLYTASYHGDDSDGLTKLYQDTAIDCKFWYYLPSGSKSNSGGQPKAKTGEPLSDFEVEWKSENASWPAGTPLDEVLQKLLGKEKDTKKYGEKTYRFSFGTHVELCSSSAFYKEMELKTIRSVLVELKRRHEFEFKRTPSSEKGVDYVLSVIKNPPPPASGKRYTKLYTIHYTDCAYIQSVLESSLDGTYFNSPAVQFNRERFASDLKQVVSLAIEREDLNHQMRRFLAGVKGEIDNLDSAPWRGLLLKQSTTLGESLADLDNSREEVRAAAESLYSVLGSEASLDPRRTLRVEGSYCNYLLELSRTVSANRLADENAPEAQAALLDLIAALESQNNSLKRNVPIGPDSLCAAAAAAIEQCKSLRDDFLTMALECKIHDGLLQDQNGQLRTHNGQFVENNATERKKLLEAERKLLQAEIGKLPLIRDLEFYGGSVTLRPDAERLEKAAQLAKAAEDAEKILKKAEAEQQAVDPKKSEDLKKANAALAEAKKKLEDVRQDQKKEEKAAAEEDKKRNAGRQASLQQALDYLKSREGENASAEALRRLMTRLYEVEQVIYEAELVYKSIQAKDEARGIEFKVTFEQFRDSVVLGYNRNNSLGSPKQAQKPRIPKVYKHALSPAADSIYELASYCWNYNCSPGEVHDSDRERKIPVPDTCRGARMLAELAQSMECLHSSTFDAGQDTDSDLEASALMASLDNLPLSEIMLYYQSVEAEPAVAFDSTGIDIQQLAGPDQQAAPASGSQLLSGFNRGTIELDATVAGISPTDLNGTKKDDTLKRLDANRKRVLAITAREEQHNIIDRIIRELDAPPTSIKLDVVVCEIDDTGRRSLGVEHESSTGFQFDEIGLGEGSAKFEAFSLGDFYRVGGLSFQATLKHMVAEGHAHVLVNTTLSTLENNEAHYFVGDLVPIKGGTATETSTRLGDIAAFSNLQYVPIGINLLFSPRLGRYGDLTIGVKPSISTFLEQDDDPRLPKYIPIGMTTDVAPLFTFREVNTIVSVMDGEPFVLAGMISEEDKVKVRKIPGLGDLPLAGKLFRSKEVKRKTTEVCIFVIPRVVSSNPPELYDYDSSADRWNRH